MHFPLRLFSGCMAALMLSGCASHQHTIMEEDTSVDAAASLAITPQKNTEFVRREHQVITGPNPPKTDVVDPDVYHEELIPVEVLRTGRYQLVTTRAPIGQRYLLEQTIHVRIPPSVVTTVGDGIRYTLNNTGISLCAGHENNQGLLFNSPLPATHYQLGPMSLREALQVLAGEAWELEIDPVRREVCYQQRDIRTVETWGLVNHSVGERGDL